MAIIKLVTFKVNGEEDGRVSPECSRTADKVRDVLVELTIDVTRQSGDPNPLLVPVWIGEYGVFWSDDLIDDKVAATAAVGVSQRIRLLYLLSCSKSCKLTPSVLIPGSAPEMTTGKSSMTLRAGYRWIGMWWYGQGRIEVSCTCELEDSAAERAFLERAEREGLIRITPKGRRAIERGDRGPDEPPKPKPKKPKPKKPKPKPKPKAKTKKSVALMVIAGRYPGRVPPGQSG